MNIPTTIRASGIAVTLFLLAACDAGSGSSTGQLTIGLTDGPVESATAVVVAFSGLQLKAAGDAEPMDPVLFDSDSCDEFADDGVCYIDLLELRGTESRVVFSEQVPAGSYEWIRLLVNAERNVMDSYIMLDAETQCSLYIPSSANTGLKIVSGITVTANGTSSYMLDFDVRKSITAPPGQAGELDLCAQNYVGKPAIRIVDVTKVGTIAGTVSAETLASAACATNVATGEYENVAVYVFDNADGQAVADDIDAVDDGYPSPVTTASVIFDVNEATYVYEAGFLLSPQNYLLALTCTADLDMPDGDDFEPVSAGPQDFGFIAEGTVTTILDGSEGIAV